MILFFAIGLLLMGLGVYAKVHSYRMDKLGLTKAKVIDCKKTTKKLGSLDIPCCELTLEIKIDGGGPVQRSVKHDTSYSIGDEVDIYYDSASDKIEFPKNISPKDSKGPYILIGFGAFICLLLGMSELAKHSDEMNRAFMQGLATFVAEALAFGGLYLGIIRPAKRKKAMSFCRKVPGKLVDYRRKGSRSEGYTYEPIYEFYYNGEVLRIDGEMSSSGSKFRRIGKEVTIVINEETGEKYCLDDVAGIKKSAIMCMIIGFALLVVLPFIDFGQATAEDTVNTVSGDSLLKGVELEFIEGKEYSNAFLDMPEDESFSEYYHVSTEEMERYTYNIKVYDGCGVGVVTIFPNRTTGKGFHQMYSFYVDEEKLEAVVQDAKDYEFDSLAVDSLVSGDKTELHEYLYRYDGTERLGSGGYGVKASLFHGVAQNIIDAVPDNVWEAIEDEMDRYYLR
ncbi:MAG: hypothetical protein IJW18_04255 [Lachnospiraceae bacterium]|nr:hypothetical protein [Lachnospiraceae bacterium]